MKKIVIQGNLDFVEKIIEVVNKNPEDFEIFGIIVNYASKELEMELKKHQNEITFVCIINENDAISLKMNLPKLEVYNGEKGVETVLRLSNTVAIIKEGSIRNLNDNEVKNYMLNAKSKIQNLAA